MKSVARIQSAKILIGIVVVFGPVLSSLGCSSQDAQDIIRPEQFIEELVPLEESSESPHGAVQLEYAGSIGSEDQDGYFFATVRGIQINAEDNVVVFDGILRNIRVFSPAGDLLRTIELPEGEGPGEYRRASTFSLSEDKKHFYMYDMVNRRVTIHDYETFDYLKDFSLHQTQHAAIHGGPENTVIAVYNQLDLGRDRSLVHVFTENGSAVAAFDRRHGKYAEYLEEDLQRFHHVSMTQSDSLIFLSFALPYDVRVYNRRFELLKRFHRTPDFFGSKTREDEWIYPSGWCTGIVMAGGELVLQVVINQVEDELWMHAFDFSGRHRGEQKLSGNEWGNSFVLAGDALDSKGNIYAVSYDPFPRIIRFRVVPVTPSP